MPSVSGRGSVDPTPFTPRQPEGPSPRAKGGEKATETPADKKTAEAKNVLKETAKSVSKGIKKGAKAVKSGTKNAFHTVTRDAFKSREGLQNRSEAEHLNAHTNPLYNQEGRERVNPLHDASAPIVQTPAKQPSQKLSWKNDLKRLATESKEKMGEAKDDFKKIDVKESLKKTKDSLITSAKNVKSDASKMFSKSKKEMEAGESEVTPQRRVRVREPGELDPEANAQDHMKDLDRFYEK